MVTALWSLLAGAVFGLALAAPPGPMNAIIAEESVRNGWIAGFRAGLGAMTADATFFLLALVGGVSIVQRAPTIRGVMVGIGGGLMLFFAYGAASDALAATGPAGAVSPATTGGTDSTEQQERATTDSTGTDSARAEFQHDAQSTPDAPSRGFRKAFALAITNPYQLVFWLTVGIRLLDPGTVDVLARIPAVGGALAGRLVVETGSPALVAGFFGGIAVWILLFPTALVRARRRLESTATIIAAASAAVLAGYGVLFLADAVTTLLG